MRLLRRTRLPTGRSVTVSTFLLRKVLLVDESPECIEMLTMWQLLCTLGQGEPPLDRRRRVPRNGPNYTITSEFGFAKRVIVFLSRCEDGDTGAD